MHAYSVYGISRMSGIKVLTKLIEPPDNFELIRQQIVAILICERDNQKVLAGDESKPVEDWDFKVYEERFEPWEQVVNETNPVAVPLPIVNVWFDSDSFAESSSTRAETQKCTAAYNIDIYGFGIAEETIEGHKPADLLASNNCKRVTALVRNILMAAQNTYLQLPRGTAWDRKLESRQSYQPRLDQRPVIEVVALRMRFKVSFNEVSPQFEGVPLAEVVATVERCSDGEVLSVLNFNYT